MKKLAFVFAIFAIFLFGCSPKITKQVQSTDDVYYTTPVAQTEEPAEVIVQPAVNFSFYVDPFPSYYWYQPYSYQYYSYYPYYGYPYYTWYPYYSYFYPWYSWNHSYHYWNHHNYWNHNNHYYGPRRSLSFNRNHSSKYVNSRSNPQQLDRSKRTQSQPKYVRPTEKRTQSYYPPKYRQPKSRNKYVSPKYRPQPIQPRTQPVRTEPIRLNPVYSAPTPQQRQAPSIPRNQNTSQPVKNSNGRR